MILAVVFPIKGLSINLLPAFVAYPTSAYLKKCDIEILDFYILTD
jgi:hypothetical protein